MANVYKWSIVKMTAHTQEQGFTDVVYSADWVCAATDGENAVSTNGTQLVPFNGGENFVPVSSLTEDMVVGWVKDAMGQQTVSTIESQLSAQLQEIAAPKTVDVALPWAV